MPRNTTLYEADFHAWTIEQARLLRAGELSAVDAANIAEEIESLGRRDRRELRNRLTVLAMHLLKRSKQPGLRSRSWSATIREQRRQIGQILADSPSLRPYVGEALAEVYEDSRLNAAAETGLADETFPATCPFSADDILSPAFLPEP